MERAEGFVWVCIQHTNLFPRYLNEHNTILPCSCCSHRTADWQISDSQWPAPRVLFPHMWKPQSATSDQSGTQWWTQRTLLALKHTKCEMGLNTQWSICQNMFDNDSLKNFKKLWVNNESKNVMQHDTNSLHNYKNIIYM